MEEEKSLPSGLWYVLSGITIGIALGILFAPKRGSELRKDIDHWIRNSRKKNRTWMNTLGSIVPLKVKAAATLGAVKAGGAEAIREVRESFFNGTDK